MQKNKVFTRATAATLACFMVGGTFFSGAGLKTIHAEEQRSTQWDEIQNVVSQYYGEWKDTAYSGQISSTLPNTALLGNGDVGVVSGGTDSEKTFYISKGDFWSANKMEGPVGESVNTVTVGGVTLKQAENNTKIDLSSAKIKACEYTEWESPMPEYIIDGDVNTKWCSTTQHENNEPHWAIIDLGEQQQISAYKLYNANLIPGESVQRNTKDFAIEYLPDEVETDWENIQEKTGWVTLDQASNNDQDIYTQNFSQIVNARYVRLLVNKASSEAGKEHVLRIQELELFSEPMETSKSGKNLALNKAVTVSSYWQNLDQHSGARMVDGDINTKWNTSDEDRIAQVGEHWAVIDLGKKEEIASWKLTSTTVPELYTSDFQLQYSEDGSTDWVTFTDIQGNEERSVFQNLEEPVVARYVRLLVTKGEQNANEFARVNELELYSELDYSVPFYEKQNILQAQVETNCMIGNAPLTMKTWTAPSDNLIVMEVTSNGEKPVALQLDTWAKNEMKDKFPIEASANTDENIATAQRSTWNAAADNSTSWTSKAALSSKVIGAEAAVTSNSDQGKATSIFTIPAGDTVYIVTAVGGGGQTYNNAGELQNENEPIEDAKVLLDSVPGKDDIAQLYDSHEEWWKDYWSASFIDLQQDNQLDKIEKYYYGAQYMLGCTTRAGELAPGLYGVWTTTTRPTFNGDYHLNYNFISTFYGAASSNRTSLLLPSVETMEDLIPLGKANAEDTSELLEINKDFVQRKIDKGDIDPVKGIQGGIVYDVAVAPWGHGVHTKESSYHSLMGEVMAAPYSAYSMIQYYNFTQDEEFLETTLYPFLKKCLTFLESWIEKEEDGESYKYTHYAAYNEFSWSINPAIEIAAYKNALKTAIDASETLNIDAERREKWIDIYTHMAKQPVAQWNGKEVYSLAEKVWNGTEFVALSNPVPADGNILPLDSVMPGDELGYFSTPKELEIARNTIDVFGNGAWSQINNFPRIFTDAIKTRYPAEVVVNKMESVINAQMQANLRISDGTHGVEKIGATEAVNSMLLLSDKGITKVFPNWLEDKDAKFANLRADGAFIVSAEYDGTAREAKNVVITSEKGKTMTLVTPWADGATVRDSAGNVVKTTAGTVPNWEDEKTITFDTKAGETYTVEKGQAPVDPELDYTEIDKVIAEADAIMQDGYTQESYQALQSALKNAKDARQNAATQEELTQKKDELRAAIDGLRGSKTILETFLNRAKQHVENGDVDGLVASVQKLFAEAIAEGEAIMEREDASKEDVFEASLKLMKAIHALDMKAGDKADLGMTLELTNMIDLTKYVEAGQKEYLAAKAEAEGVMENGDAMQPEVDAAWTTLVDTMMNLRLKADKAALSDLLESLKDLDLNKYTEESVRTYNEALALANTIMNDEGLSVDDQAKVDEAVVMLMAARDGLTEKKGSGDDNKDDPNGNGGQNNNGQDPNGNGQNGDNQNGNGGKQDGNKGGNSQPATQTIKTGDAVSLFIPIIGILLSIGAAITIGVVVIRRKHR